MSDVGARYSRGFGDSTKSAPLLPDAMITFGFDNPTAAAVQKVLYNNLVRPTWSTTSARS